MLKKRENARLTSYWLGRKCVYCGSYQYRGVSRSNFPLYLKEMEYRFNHRRDNLLKDFIQLYFGYVSEQYS